MSMALMYVFLSVYCTWRVMHNHILNLGIHIFCSCSRRLYKNICYHQKHIICSPEKQDYRDLGLEQKNISKDKNCFHYFLSMWHPWDWKYTIKINHLCGSKYSETEEAGLKLKVKLLLFAWLITDNHYDGYGSNKISHLFINQN